MKRRAARDVLILFTVAVAASAAFAAASVKPVLRFASLAPVIVEGTGFVARERLQVVVSVDGSLSTREIQASDDGAFTVHFREVTLRDRCSTDIRARATAARIVRAHTKLPQPQCPPAL